MSNLPSPPRSDSPQEVARWQYFVTEMLNGRLALGGLKVASVYDDVLLEINPEDDERYADAGALGGLANTGTSTGTYLDTRARNNIGWKIYENNGTTDDYLISTTTPMVFNDIYQVPAMYWSGIYVGTAGHAANMKWIVYNNSSSGWDDLAYTFVASASVYDAIVTGFTADHINASKQVKIACKHPDTGVATHFLQIDQIYMLQDNLPKKVYYKGGYVYLFRNTGFDAAHGRVQLGHGYKEGTGFYWHVHFIPTVAITDGETVIFTLTKTFCTPYYKFDTESTLTATFTNNAAWRATLTTAQAADILSGTSVVVDAHIYATGASAISGTDIGISAIGLCEIKRDAGTHVSDVYVIYSDFHIEVEGLGSRTEWTK